MKKNIGPKMEAVVRYVEKHPGCTKLAAGNAAWGSWKQARMGFIYRPVDRAIKAGLVNANRSDSGNKYELYPVD